MNSGQDWKLEVEMQTPDEIDQLLAAARQELSGLDTRREAILDQIDNLERQRALLIEGSANTLEDLGEPAVTNCTSSEHLRQNINSTKRVFSVPIYPGV